MPRFFFHQDLAKVINDGLFYYEDGLWHDDDDSIDGEDDSWTTTDKANGREPKKNVNLISQETFARIRTVSETLNEASSPFKKAPLKPTSAEEEMEVRTVSL